MDYKGVEVIVRQDGGDPLTHPVDAMTIGAKAFGMGTWVSVAQIVSLLVKAMGGDIPYRLDVGELELRIGDGDALLNKEV